MNKERAKMSKEMAICILKEYKSISEDRKLYHERLILEKKDSDFVLDKEQVQRSEKDIEDFNKNIQALDIAIDSLEQEKNIKDCIIELQAFDLTLKDLTEVGRIEESVFNTFSNIIKQIIERLEPYERKE